MSAPGAAGQDVGLPVLVQALDGDLLAHARPGLGEEGFLQLGEASFGGAHQVTHRRVNVTHERQGLFGGNAPIHDPDPVGLAVPGLDLGQKILEGLLVEGIAGEDLVGQGKTVRGNDQGDDHLDAGGAMVATVAMLALTGLGRIALEVGAGEVIEQDLVASREEVAPALLQVGEQGPLVRQQPVQATVEGVALGDGEVFAKQIAHSAAVIPLPVQAPLAARVDEAVG